MADSPWYGGGRFGTGSYKTLYVASSARGAMAEFFRRHPEFLDLQEDLMIRLFKLDLRVEGECLDVRTEDAARAVGIEPSRLTSSDPDEDVRYRECRELAGIMLERDGTGITYPSASTGPPTWNFVLFGDQKAGRWVCLNRSSVEIPRIDAEQVNILV